MINIKYVIAKNNSKKNFFKGRLLHSYVQIKEKTLILAK